MLQTSEEVGVLADTVLRNKRAFAEMSEEERALLLSTLFDEKWRELVRSEPPLSEFAGSSQL